MKNIFFSLAVAIGFFAAFRIGVYYGRKQLNLPKSSEIYQIAKNHEFYKNQSAEISKKCDTLRKQMIMVFDREAIVVKGKVSGEPLKDLFFQSAMQLRKCSSLLNEYKKIYFADSVFISRNRMLVDTLK